MRDDDTGSYSGVYAGISDWNFSFSGGEQVTTLTDKLRSRRWKKWWVGSDEMKKKQDKRGKWARDKWIRILELLTEMPPEERQRCIRATAEFYRGR